MLWFILSCVVGVTSGEDLTTISFEQTKAAHYVDSNNALKSSVRLAAYNEEGKEVGHGSGNYFKIGGHKFIITAAHNILKDTVLEVADGYRSYKTFPVLIDFHRDIAIIVPEVDLKKSRAIEYKTNSDEIDLGQTVTYTGYPADLGKSLFTGTIANDQRYTMMMQSFALPGSSGSVVFDTKGRAMAVISALRLGVYDFSPFPQMHPTLVYCQKLRDYDRFSIRGIIERWKKSRSEP